MSDCPRLGKLIGGCKFRPRYDTVTAREGVLDMVFLSDRLVQARDRPGRSTYIADVCERCGKMLNRRVTAKPKEAKP